MKKSSFKKGRGKTPPIISKKTAKRVAYIQTGNCNLDDIQMIETFKAETGNAITESSMDFSSSSSDSFSSGGGDFGGGGADSSW